MPASAGRYELVSLLGKGSMGEVWRGIDPRIGRPVAVKLLSVPEGTGAADAREWEERFLREARAAGRLSHPVIVPVHDAGTTEDGRPYLVMELVEGRSLEDLLREDGPVPPARALAWGACIAEALDAAHRKGVVHRDLKPANILINREGEPRLVDFGIARFTESDLTREGIFLGSPAFSSPEQIRGEGLDGRSDLFSLGAVLYTILCGVRPFTGKDLPSLAYAICHAEPPPLERTRPGLPRAAASVVQACLSKSVANRYQTGRQLSEALRAAAGAPLQEPATSGRDRLLDTARQGAMLWMRGWRHGPVTRVVMMSAILLAVTAALRVPAALGRPLAVPMDLADPGVMQVRVTHPLTRGDVSVWADGRRVLNENLRREAPTGGLSRALTGWRRGSGAWAAQVPAEVTRLRVKIGSSEPKFEVDREILCEPSAGARRVDIRVRVWPSARVSMECGPAASP
jgi:hypothetical protein